jgi:alpha-N-acetylglucosamine transferase
MSIVDDGPLRDRAYVTVLSTDDYLPGVLALALSLRVLRTRFPLYVLVGRKVSRLVRVKLEQSGIDMIEASDLHIPPEIIAANLSSDYHKHWAGVFEKLLIFSLTQFEKIVYLDSDMLVLRGIDDLFDRPHMTAVSADVARSDANRLILNAGLMVIEPRVGLTDELIATLPTVYESEKRWRTQAGRPVSMGVQSVINSFWPSWAGDTQLHLHPSYNVLVSDVDHYVRRRGYRAFGNNGIRVLHFIGARKPWMYGSWDLATRILRLIARGRFIEGAVTSLYGVTWVAARLVLPRLSARKRRSGRRHRSSAL